MVLYRNDEHRSCVHWACPFVLWQDQYILKMHIRMRHMEPDVLFQCNLCSKMFTRKAHLKRHLRIHNPDKPYKCPHCDYRLPLVPCCARKDLRCPHGKNTKENWHMEILVLASKSRCTGISALALGVLWWMKKGWHQARPLVVFSACVSSVLWHCWLGHRKGVWSIRNLCHLCPHQNKCRKKTEGELANPGLPGKWPINGGGDMQWPTHPDSKISLE